MGKINKIIYNQVNYITFTILLVILPVTRHRKEEKSKIKGDLP